MEQNALPLGFGMALAQQPDALNVFAALPKARKDEIIQRAHSVSSKDEMQALVQSLVGLE